MSLELPFGLKVINPFPADDKYLNNGVPYNSITQVNTVIPISIRHIGLTVNILGDEYWYKDGVNNTNLVLKQSDSASFTAYTATTEIRLENIESDIFDLQVFSANTNNIINNLQSDILYLSGITNSKQDVLTAGGGISSAQLTNDILALDLNNYIAPNNISLTITGTSAEFKIFDNSTVKTGVEYGADYSPFFSPRSLVDKQYVDSLVSSLLAGLSPKNSVFVATTINIPNLNNYVGSIDGISVPNGSRVLIKNQTNNTQNGIYIYNNPVFTRAIDFDSVGEINSGSFTTIISGNTQANTAWILTSASIINTGFTEPIIWSQFAIPTGGISSIQNVGTGAIIHSGTTSGIAYLKSLTRSGDIQLIPNANDITIRSIFTGSSTSTVNLGGISSGYVLSGKTFSQILRDLLSPALNPTLVAPSSTFTMSPFTNGQNLEVGTTVNITFTALFNRGSISPQYPPTLSPFRSGLPNTYNYVGSGLVTTFSTLLTDIQNVNSYIILAGSNNWLSSITYDAGVQPHNSAGAPFSTPLAAGTTGSIVRTLNGIYPYFFGRVASGGVPSGVNRPIATNALINSGTKVVLPSTGTIIITFGSTPDDYLWFAIPQSSTSKTRWHVDALNNGNIGGSVSPAGNLFPSESIVSVTTVFWSGIPYKVYISNYQTATTGVMEMRNS